MPWNATYARYTDENWAMNGRGSDQETLCRLDTVIRTQWLVQEGERERREGVAGGGGGGGGGGGPCTFGYKLLTVK